ncbi:MAG: nuclease-related domain-containing protein, partial [Gammaproteobacteria bacterium]|nr:nuclease-related domain-containing protein [Gammaproteobacteria bacterium]
MNALLQHEMLIPVIGGSVLLLVLIGIAIYYKRRSQRPEQRLRSVAKDLLADFLIPNGDDGEITVGLALLTRCGIVIVDLKDVEGNVFGSDSMQDWTVISDDRRFTFSNPQFALYDRLAAVRRLVDDIPVTGYVAFTKRGEFSKGQPSDVIQLDVLVNNLQAESQEG